MEEANDDGCDFGVLSIVAIIRDALASTSVKQMHKDQQVRSRLE